MTYLLIQLITLYQRTLSPDHGWFSFMNPAGHCRYQPTCSEYAKESIRSHGAIKGTFLSVARISRCHPWSTFGADPILNNEHN